MTVVPHLGFSPKIETNMKGQDKTYHEPLDNVRVCRRAGATGLNLITGGLDDNWVIKGTCTRTERSAPIHH